MILAPQKAISIVKAKIVLHNFLCPQLTCESDDFEPSESSRPTLSNGERIALTPIRRQERRYSFEAGKIQMLSRLYFWSDAKKVL